MTPSPPAVATAGGGTKKGASGRNRKRPAATKKKQQFNVLENDVDLIKASSSAGGYYALQFQDDKTGRKNIHPSAMRFALRIMEEEAQLCTKSVAQSLVENSELEESKRVQVRSSHHTKIVVSNVRKRFRETPIPLRYVRIDDVTLNELATINSQRKEEIKENYQLIKRLEQQRESMQKEHDKARYQRDQLQERLAHVQGIAARSCVNPFLSVYTEQMRTRRDDKIDHRVAEKIGTKRPSDESLTMANLLAKVASPYDDII